MNAQPWRIEVKTVAHEWEAVYVTKDRRMEWATADDAREAVQNYVKSDWITRFQEQISGTKHITRGWTWRIRSGDMIETVHESESGPYGEWSSSA